MSALCHLVLLWTSISMLSWERMEVSHLPGVYCSQGKGQVKSFLAFLVDGNLDHRETPPCPSTCLCLIGNSLSPLYAFKDPTPVGYNLKAGLELQMKLGSIFKITPLMFSKVQNHFCPLLRTTQLWVGGWGRFQVPQKLIRNNYSPGTSARVQHRNQQAEWWLGQRVARPEPGPAGN